MNILRNTIFDKENLPFVNCKTEIALENKQ